LLKRLVVEGRVKAGMEELKKIELHGIHEFLK